MTKLCHPRELPGWLVVGLAVLGSYGVCPATISLAQDKPAQAKQEFMAGVEAFEAGRHTTALKHFQEAHRLKPHPLVRVNIANCYVKLDRPIEAVFHFKKFLRSKEGDPAQREEIAEEVGRLKSRIGAVQLSISPDGAKVNIDDGDTRTAPIMEEIQLAQGPHKIKVTLHGFQAYQGDFRVKGGKTVDLNVRLQRAGGAPVAAVTPKPKPAPEAQPEPEPEAGVPQQQPPPEPIEEADIPVETVSHPIRPVTWYMIAGTGVALTTAIVLGLLFQSADDDFQQNADIATDSRESAQRRAEAWNLGRDALETSQGLAAAADVMFVITALGVGVTGYFLLNDLAGTPVGGEHAAGLGPRRARQGETRLTPMVGIDRAGLSLQHTF